MDEAEKLEWLKSRIYAPVERVRARRNDQGDWEVFDGIEVHMYSDADFGSEYELCSQTLYEIKERGQYEYHSSKPTFPKAVTVPDHIQRERERSAIKAGRQ